MLLLFVFYKQQLRILPAALHCLRCAIGKEGKQAEAKKKPRMACQRRFWLAAGQRVCASHKCGAAQGHGQEREREGKMIFVGETLRAQEQKHKQEPASETRQDRERVCV